MPHAPNKFADNPYEPPHGSNAAKATTVGMTTGEKIYSAVVLLCAGFLLMSLASFHFIIIPGARDPGVFYFIVSILWMMVLTLAATTIPNLCYRSLLIVPTIVQCVVLCFMVYFIPIAIWGGVLLYWRLQRAKLDATSRAGEN